jgi:hypothetical protein
MTMGGGAPAVPVRRHAGSAGMPRALPWALAEELCGL